MAERHFNPNAFANQGPQQNVITFDQLLTWHAYFKSITDPSEEMTKTIKQLETRILTIVTQFNQGALQ